MKPDAPDQTVTRSPDDAPSVNSSAHSTIGHGQPTQPVPLELPRFAPPTAAGELGRLGKYRILKELGRGGMGAVYLAFDERLERQVALKVMLPKAAANPTAKDRFLREARSAARISSDYVVNIHEADEIDGTPYIALQFLQGYPLDEYLKKKGNPTTPQAIRIARETALGLAAAHKLGLVHRDIKPGNIWLEAPGGRVKVLDFGLAKPVNGKEFAELTASGAVVGTPNYMAPEQGMGKPVDGRADLFSLGCVLYRLVAGRLPFERPTLMAILTAIAIEEPTPVREVNPAVPAPLADLIHRLMAKKPDQRPASAKDVADELTRIATPPNPAVSPEAPTMAPQVVYVPINVSVQEPNPFEHLHDSSTEYDPQTPTPPPAAKQKRLWPLAVVGVGLFAVLAVAGFIIIKITNKDGTVTEVKVPDGAKVEVSKDGKPVVTVNPDGKATTATTPGAPPPVKAPAPAAAGLPAGKSGLRFTMGDMATATKVPVRPTTLVTLEAWLTFEAVQEFAGRELIRTPNGSINTNDGRLGFYSFHGGAGAKDLIANGRRVHVAAVNDGKKRYLYFDGKRIAESEDAGIPIPENEQEALGEKLTVIALGSDLFTGTIDAVRVSTTARYEKEFTPPAEFKKDKDTFALYLFDEGKGDTLNDSSGNGYHAKITGAKWVKGVDADLDRKTAEWVLSVGGKCSLRVNEKEKIYSGKDTLPTGPCELVNAEITREQASDETASRFVGLSKLQLLSLVAGPLTDTGVAKLRDLPALYYLNLDSTKVTDAGLPALKQLPELKILILANTKVTDDGLAALKVLPKLEAVVLDHTAITDEGLLQLRAAPSLTLVKVPGAKVTEAGVKKLAAALPKCKIEYDGGVIEPAKK